MSDVKQIAIRTSFSIKTIRRAIALIGEAATDEEINKRFVDIDPIDINFDEMVGETDALQMCIAFVALIIAKEQDIDIPTKVRPASTSIWQQRLDEMGKK